VATVGVAAHVIFELGAGVAMPLKPYPGPVSAATLWAGYAGGVSRAAATKPVSADRAFTVTPIEVALIYGKPLEVEVPRFVPRAPGAGNSTAVPEDPLSTTQVVRPHRARPSAAPSPFPCP